MIKGAYDHVAWASAILVGEFLSSVYLIEKAREFTHT